MYCKTKLAAVWCNTTFCLSIAARSYKNQYAENVRQWKLSSFFVNKSEFYSKSLYSSKQQGIVSSLLIFKSAVKSKSQNMSGECLWWKIRGNYTKQCSQMVFWEFLDIYSETTVFQNISLSLCLWSYNPYTI